MRGEFYGLHRDNSEPATAAAARPWRPRRTATVIVYLTTPKSGGETFFPHVSIPAEHYGLRGRAALRRLGVDAWPGGGVAVRPRAGNCLVFWSVLACGMDDLAAAHSAEPVEDGVKWIATRWCSEAC